MQAALSGCRASALGSQRLHAVFTKDALRNWSCIKILSYNNHIWLLLLPESTVEVFPPRTSPQVRHARHVHYWLPCFHFRCSHSTETACHFHERRYGAMRAGAVPAKVTLFIAQICPQLWADPAHLEQRCGHKQVAVHVTQVQQMDFLSKNFVYRTLPFGEAVKRCRRTRHEDFFVSSDEMSAIFSVVV